jgi:transcriptional regulator with XRE-family HTH domain
MSNSTKTIHEGRNVKRFREMLGIKQEALATALGDDWNQKKISLLEAKENIEPAILEDVAKALKVPVEAIQNFDEERAVNIISNNSFENCAQPASVFYNSPVNPIEKWIETLEENKKLYAALLKEKDEKIELLEKLLQK